MNSKYLLKIMKTKIEMSLIDSSCHDFVPFLGLFGQIGGYLFTKKIGCRLNALGTGFIQQELSDTV